MSKWFGKIGYAVSEQTEPGLWENTIVEREYYGDMTSNRFKRQTSGEVNDNINYKVYTTDLNSTVADPFAYQNCSSIAYVYIMGDKWKITDVEIQHPRLILTVGGVYNGE